MGSAAERGSAGSSAVLDGGVPPPVASIEQRGIEYVPLDHRWGKPSGLFWMWAGAVWNVEFVLYGALAVLIFGLSFAQAVTMIIVGNFFYVLTGLASLQGPRAGTTTFAISRAPFGPHGNRLPSFFNWVTQVGFEIEGIAFVVLAVIAIGDRYKLVSGTPAKIVIIVIAVAIQALLPTLGHAAVLKVLRWLTLPFVALFVIMAILTTSKVNLHVPAHGAPWGSVMIFLAVVISAGGLGWTENANDYSRYLPPGADRKRIVMAVALGGGIASALLEVLGAAIATGVPGITSVQGIAGLTQGFPSWFIVPFLIVAIFQLFAINTIDLYSSGVTLQSLIPKLKRVQCVAIDTVVCGGFTAYAIFSGKFFSLLAAFLLFIIVWLGPWCAIYLIDSWLRKNRYDTGGLLNERGRYYRRGGVFWPAIIAQVVGMIAAAVWLNAFSSTALSYEGPLASRIGGSFGSDFSVFMGLIVGGIVYYVLAARTVRAEGEATPVLPEA
ncbi:MAG TPA: cytosine permease [Streptosporangiaceae bacterium]|nr:cytosine permease [Streptosporangiaceae bacterium]